jgi:hypothetical protein
METCVGKTFGGPRRLEDNTKIGVMFGRDVMGTGFIVEAAALMRAQKFVTTIKRRGGGWL